MTTYDRLNFFAAFIKSNKLRPSAQLLYFHLLQINNSLRCVNSFYASDRMLSEITNMSLRAITDAKRILKSFGLIDFKNVNHRTKYFFPDDGRYTPNHTDNIQPDIQNSQGRVGITVPNKHFNQQEEKRDGDAKNLRFNKINSIDVDKNSKATEELHKKIHPEISEEERAKARKLAQEFLSRIKKID